MIIKSTKLGKTIQFYISRGTLHAEIDGAIITCCRGGRDRGIVVACDDDNLEREARAWLKSFIRREDAEAAM